MNRLILILLAVLAAGAQEAPKTIYVEGLVKRPGAYALDKPTTVVQALIMAGGFKDFANQKSIVIQRGTQRFKFNYTQVVNRRQQLEQNIKLEPGDLIIVK